MGEVTRNIRVGVSLVLAGVTVLLVPSLARAAATVTIVNLDGAGEGLNDPTAVAPVGGNPGTTLGAQRLNALQYAADAWGGEIQSAVEIRVGANFDPLSCTTTSGILGSAGPVSAIRDFAGAPRANTWYTIAHANSLAGVDLIPGSDDIGATFNSDVGMPGCLDSLSWYYGFDGTPPPGGLDFTGTALHEIGHGLGVLSLVNLSTGAKFNQRDDAYMVHLENHGTGELYPDMTNRERVVASRSVTDLHWTGPSVVGYSGNLTAGVHSPSGHVEMYAPTPQEPGSSVSHFSTTVTPNDLMEPFHNNDATTNLTLHLIEDLGWELATPVILSGFDTSVAGGSVVVSWSTDSEIDTVGFHLLRQEDGTGGYVQVNGEILPGVITAPQGGTYRLVDTGARPGSTYEYLLAEVTAGGEINTYGPFSVGPTGSVTDSPDPAISHGADPVPAALMEGNRVGTGKQKTEPARPKVSVTRDRDGTLVVEAKKQRLKTVPGGAAKGYNRLPRGEDPASVSRREARRAAGEQHREEARLKKYRRTGPAVKIPVSDARLHYLAAPEIGRLMGLSEAAVRHLMTRRELLLRTAGRDVPYLPAADGSGLTFYGEPPESIYTDENIYWLAEGTSREMSRSDGGAPDEAISGTFRDALHIEIDQHPATGLFHEPEADFWLWDFVFAGNTELAKKEFGIAAPGVASVAGSARVVVHLKGATGAAPSDDHHVVVSLNGAKVGESTWKGTAAHSPSFDFPQDLLIEGENIVAVEAVRDDGVPYSIFYVDSFDLAYERIYRAEDGAITVRSDGNEVITVEGFTSADIVVLDVTSGQEPVLVADTTVRTAADSSYQVSFVPRSDDAVYHIAALSSATEVTEAWADAPSNLRDARGATYVVIAPAELMDSARKLAAYREGTGLSTLVVDIEDVYDEFNEGLRSPAAIAGFLRHATDAWQVPPVYLLLAGEGSYDYRDVRGYSDSVIPPMMVDTPFGLAPSDTVLGDVNGDGVAEVALGRIPVLTDAELDAVAAKIRAFEGTTVETALLVSDNADSGGDFAIGSGALSLRFPPGYPVEQVSLDGHSRDETRVMLFDRLDRGLGYIGYIGHAGVNSLADEGLLRTEDVAGLRNAHPPILTAMTCVVGNYALPGYDSLSEALLLHPKGGSVAVWSATGLSRNSSATDLTGRIYDEIFGSGARTLGEAVLGASQGFATSKGTLSSVLGIYNLQGDPATMVGR